VDPQRAGREEPVASWPVLALAAGTGLGVAALVLAAAVGPPYLDLSSLNPFVAVFAGAAFGALFAVPFAANRLLGRARPERAESWEAAMLIWGAGALVLLVISCLMVLPGELSASRSLVDAAALVLLVESVLVVLVLAAWILAG
jgi:hypothetical protein